MENPKKFQPSLLVYAEAEIKNYQKQDRSVQSDTSTCTQWHVQSPLYIYKIPGIHMAHSYNMSDVRVSYPHPAMRSTLHMDVTNVVVMKAETLRISLTKQPLLG